MNVDMIEEKERKKHMGGSVRGGTRANLRHSKSLVQELGGVTGTWYKKTKLEKSRSQIYMAVDIACKSGLGLENQGSSLT